MTANKRRNKLADLLRTGRGTSAMEAEYEALENKRERKPKSIATIYDLPIAKRMWEADVVNESGTHIEHLANVILTFGFNR